MSLSNEIKQSVRVRANYLCEFCSVSEISVGGLLTNDHFQPTSKGGKDILSNLIYSCNRCNWYKSDYFPASSQGISLWNPRIDSRADHFFELNSGEIQPLSEIGRFTIDKLRLNRKSLVQFRLNKIREIERAILNERSKILIQLLTETNLQLFKLTRDQQLLLTEQKELIKKLLNQK